MTCFLKVENYTKKLACSQDVVDAINNQQAISNIERIKSGLKPIITIPLIHNFLNDSVVDLLVVDQLRSYYNFFTNENFELESKILSDLNASVKIPSKILLQVSQTKKKKDSNLHENIIITEKIKTEFLEAKHKRIENIIDLKENFFKKGQLKNKYFFHFL